MTWIIHKGNDVEKIKYQDKVELPGSYLKKQIKVILVRGKITQKK